MFLSYVYEELLKTVFGAIVAKTNGRIKNPVKDTYIESYKIIQDKINESETYSEIIRFAEDIPDTNKKYWNMISECLNKIDNTTYSWYDFDNLFNKNLGDNDFLYLDSLYVYIDKFVPSDIEMIISILNKLKSCNRENDVFKLCNKLLTRKIFVNEINEYITDLRKDYRKKTGK